MNEPVSSGQLTCRPHRAVHIWRGLAAFSVIYVVGLIVASLGTFSFAQFQGVTGFRPANVVQLVGGIWFGIWGVAAGVLFPMLPNHLRGDPWYAHVAANVLQSLLPLLAVRLGKYDPRLLRRRDWLGIIVIGCVLVPALSAVLVVVEANLLDPVSLNVTTTDHLRQWVARTVAHALPCLLFGPLLLWSLSPHLVRARRSVHETRDVPGRRRWARFRDQPLLVKILAAILLAGILPVLGLAAGSVVTRYNEAWSEHRYANRLLATLLGEHVNEHLQTRVKLLQGVGRMLLGQAEQGFANARSLKPLFLDGQPFERVWVPAIEELEIWHQIVPLAGNDMEQHGAALLPVMDPNQPELDSSHSMLLLKVSEQLIVAGQFHWPVLKSLRSLKYLSPEQSGWAIVDQQGLPRFQTQVSANDARLLLPSRLTTPSNQFYAPTPGGGRLVTYVTINVERFPPLKLGVVTDSRLQIASILRDTPNYVSLLVTIGIFGSFIAAGWFAQALATPVHELARSVRAMRGDPTRLSIPELGHDEVGQLGQALEQMSRDLQTHMERLRQTTAEKERLEKELDIAAKLQRSILPAAAPDLSGYQLAAQSLPAREVGGDFYDYWPIDHGRLGLLIGDAVGKGLGAAIFMTQCRAIVRAYAAHDPQPQTVLNRSNRAIAAMLPSEGWFVTLFYGVLDLTSGTIQYANAGHNPPLALRAGCLEADELGATGLPLGVPIDLPHRPAECTLNPGDVVVAYTDGLIEARDPRNDLFGEERLQESLRQLKHSAPLDMVNHLVQQAQAFSTGRPQTDDMTLLVLRRTAEE